MDSKFIQTIFCFSVFLFVGCRTFQPAVSLESENERLLPPLSLQFDEQSFSVVYPMSTYSNSVSTATINNNSSVVTTIGSGISNTYSNAHINQYVQIFETQFRGKICQKYGENKGAVVLRLKNGSYSSSIFLSYVNGFFLMIPVIFGCPFQTYGGDVQLQLDMYDSKKNLIAEYISKDYKANSAVGVYHYGSFKDAEYSVTTDLFCQALKDIKDQIKIDYDKLVTKIDIVETSVQENSAENLDRYGNLKKIKELLDQGIITQEDFNKEKEKILNSK